MSCVASSTIESSPSEFGLVRPEDGDISLRKATSVLPGVEVLDVRQYLRGGDDEYEDGWITVARFRSWIGVPAWRSRRHHMV